MIIQTNESNLQTLEMHSPVVVHLSFYEGEQVGKPHQVGVGKSSVPDSSRRHLGGVASSLSWTRLRRSRNTASFYTPPKRFKSFNI